MPDFDALFAPDSAGGAPDFDTLFAPEPERIPFRTEEALKNVPKSAFNTAKRIAADILPGQHVQTGFALAQPGGLSNAWEGLKERFGGIENIKRTAEEDPVGLAYDATGLIGGGKGLSSVKKAATGMPRAVVREEAELLRTGGARLNEAKTNPAKVATADVAGPMAKFRERLNENALDLDSQYDNAKLTGVVRRLDAAYATPKSDPMSRLTGTTPAAKPPVTLKELHAHQQRLDDVISQTKGLDGRISRDGVIALELKKTIGEIIDAHPESGTFKIGKHEYHRGKMSQELSDLHKRATQRSQWKNGDEAGALSAEISTFLRSKKARYALTPQARKRLDILSRDNKGKLMGAFGSQNIGGFTFARAAETAFGVPGLLAIPGHFARQSRNARIIKEFERIQEELRAGGAVGD
jgi:hypothetical protein